VNKELTIAIDARPLTGGYSGYTTYLISIIEPLLNHGFGVTLLSNRPLDEAHTIAKRCRIEVFGSERGSWWEQMDVPGYLQAHRHDLYLVGTNKGLPWRKARGTRYMLGLLDIIPYKFPRYYLTKIHYLLRELRPISQLISVLRADEIITISEQSATDIHHLLHRRVTPLLMKIDRLHVPKGQIQKRKQFAYVGGVDMRKKIAVLLRAFASFANKNDSYRLVLIGRGYEAFNDLADELGIKDKVTMTGFIAEEEKMRTIAESTAMVYPSEYEGYGLAIAEGFMADVPVIAGPGGSQKEVGGDGVLYVNPTDPDEIAAAMEQILEAPVRGRLAEGRKRQMAKIFGPEIEEAIVRFFVGQAERARGAK
jgi:glycosyltransferase involved in cell wall biosynthesis